MTGTEEVLTGVAVYLLPPIALLCALWALGRLEDCGSFGVSFVLLLFSLVMVWISGFAYDHDMLRGKLLEACPEKVRIAEEREFTCVVPLSIKLRDGTVQSFSFPKTEAEQ